MKKIWYSLILITIFFQNGFSQDLYNPDGLTLMEITFEDANWDQLLDDLYDAGNNERLLATIEINGISFDSVGIRYRGGATYQTDQSKNPFNIKLDYIKNHNYDGFQTLKLNNGAKDPSFVREVLSFEMANEFMPAPRANYAKVFVNGGYHGLYVNVENVDKDFMGGRFYSNRNNTFFSADPTTVTSPPAGCSVGIGASLENVGTNMNCYEDYFELESDLATGWNDLIDLVQKIDQNSAEIETYINMDRAIWMCAMNNLLVNLDSYLGAEPSNYYLFKDDNDRFNTLIWDLNETFGGDRDLDEGAAELTLSELQNLDPLARINDDEHPLLKLILQNPTYKRKYIAHYRTILQEAINSGWYSSRIQAIVNMISGEVASDPNKLYSEADFNSNLNSTVTIDYNGVMADIPGLVELMNSRLTFLQGHSEFMKTPPTISNLDHVPLNVTPNSTLTITAEISSATYAYVAFRENLTQVFQKAEMFDDGNHNDGAAGDGVYGGDVLVGVEGVQYYVYAEDATADAGVFSPEKAAEEFYSIVTYGDVVINEVLASNATTQADQDGEFDDWIELYNNTSSPINLEGYFLSDNENDLMKFEFPNVTIDGGDYIIVWVDGDPMQQGLHTDFKIDATGEEILLVNQNMQVVDKVVFGAQVTDVAWARFPNGTGQFVAKDPTFNSSNGIPDATIDLAKELGLEIFPNPADEFLFLKIKYSETINVTLHNTLGQPVRNFDLKEKIELDVSDLSNGIYWLSSEGRFLGKIVIN